MSDIEPVWGREQTDAEFAEQFRQKARNIRDREGKLDAAKFEMGDLLVRYEPVDQDLLDRLIKETGLSKATVLSWRRVAAAIPAGYRDTSLAWGAYDKIKDIPDPEARVLMVVESVELRRTIDDVALAVDDKLVELGKRVRLSAPPRPRAPETTRAPAVAPPAAPTAPPVTTPAPPRSQPVTPPTPKVTPPAPDVPEPPSNTRLTAEQRRQRGLSPREPAEPQAPTLHMANVDDEILDGVMAELGCNRAEAVEAIRETIKRTITIPLVVTTWRKVRRIRSARSPKRVP